MHQQASHVPRLMFATKFLFYQTATNELLPFLPYSLSCSPSAPESSDRSVSSSSSPDEMASAQSNHHYCHPFVACMLAYAHTHTHMHSRAGISHASLLAKCSHTNLFTKIPQWGLSAMNLVLCSCTRRRQKRTQMFKQRTLTAPAPLPGLNQISPTVPIPFHPVLSLTHL